MPLELLCNLKSISGNHNKITLSAITEEVGVGVGVGWGGAQGNQSEVAPPPLALTSGLSSRSNSRIQECFLHQDYLKIATAATV